jgi:hypothetical protein
MSGWFCFRVKRRLSTGDTKASYGAVGFRSGAGRSSFISPSSTDYDYDEGCEDIYLVCVPMIPQIEAGFKAFRDLCVLCALWRLSLKQRRSFAHLGRYVDVKRTALHTDTTFDAGRRRDRKPRVPLFDLLDPSCRDLIQVPDHPPDLDPLRTRKTVLTVVSTKDTSR